MLARSETSPFEDSEQQNLIMQVPLAMQTMQNLERIVPLACFRPCSPFRCLPGTVLDSAKPGNR